MPDPTILIEDSRTGLKVSPYLGGDPIETYTPSTPESRGDNPSAAPAAAAEPAAPATDPPATDPAVPEGQEPAAAATPPAANAEPSDQVTQEPAAEEPPAEEPLRDNNGRFIPRKRFNEVNEERKQLLRENEELKARISGQTPAPTPTPTPEPTPPAYDFVAKEREYINLVLDGKTDEALALRQEISGEQQKQFIALAREAAVTTNQQLTVQERIEAIETQFVTDYDVLNPESDNFNDDIISDVDVVFRGYSAMGRFKDNAERLEAAIKAALAMHGVALKPGAAGASTPAVPATQPATTTPSPAAPARTAKKRVEAIIGQPPVIAKVGGQGSNEGLPNIRDMPQAQFDALPIETKKRLRGDYL